MTVLDHIGIAVRSLAERRRFWEAIGLAVSCLEEIEEQHVRAAFLNLEGTRLELLEPTSPDSPIARFIEKRGEGLHHLCFQVADLGAAMARLRELGYEPFSAAPQAGAHGTRVCFVHPRSTGGVLVELAERTARDDP